MAAKTAGAAASAPAAPVLKVAPIPAVPPPSRRNNAADELRAQLVTQRAALNAEYQALAAKNVAALRDVKWNSAQPESNALLNSMSGSRAVLGISRLQMYRNSIYDTLQQLRDIAP